MQHECRPQIGQDTNVLWSAPSFLQKLYHMRFSLNSGICVGISFGSDDYSAFHLLILLKGKDSCQLVYLPINNSVTTFWNQGRKLNYQTFYTQWDYSEWQCWWDWKTSSNKIWICFYDLINMQPFFDGKYQDHTCLHCTFWLY